MVGVTGALLEQEAYRNSLRLPDADLVRELRNILGARLVAYIGSVKETRAVRQWAEGEHKPPVYVMGRLRSAYHVAALLEGRDSKRVVQAWFQGMNPLLHDVPPARLLRDGDVIEGGHAVLAAAKAFTASG